MHRIFCYGTLMKGHGNHRLLLKETTKALGKASTPSAFTMVHLGGFPGIIRGGETSIQGEVYEVDAETLARLDRLEGHPDFYRREPIEGLLMPDGSHLDAEVYVLPASYLARGKTIPSGVWEKGSW